MADLLGGMVYAAIMATVEMIKDECSKSDCCNGCLFKDEKKGACLFQRPDHYDLNKIGKVLRDTFD